MDTFFLSLVNALGWTLIHSLWQACIVFFALQLLLIVFREASARARYMLSLGALAVVMGCFLATFSWQWQYQQQLAGMQHVIFTSSAFAPALQLPEASDTYFKFFQWSDILPWLDIMYVAGLLFFTGKVLRDLVSLLTIRRSRMYPFDAAWEKYLNKLSDTWNITRRVRLYISERIDVPIVVGHLKPVIYLPFALVSNLTPAQIEAILLHELAHIKRNDFLINIFQTIAETVLFFNPFVWWISRNMRTERENCCDDLALSATQPRLYAEALLAVSEGLLFKQQNGINKGKFVLAAADKKQELFYRIKRIMEMQTKKLNMIQKLMVLVIVLGGFFSIAWLTPKNNAAKKSVVTSGPSAISEAVLLAKDTFVPSTPPEPPAPPVPPTAEKSLPAPPAPPAPPAAPDSSHTASFTWSVAGMPDTTAMANWTKQLKAYYSSAAWKQYQQALQKYGHQMKEYFNNAEWKKYQKDMQAYAQQMAKLYSHDTAWNAGRQAMLAEAQQLTAERQQQIAERFQSAEWRQHMDSIRQTLEANRPRMDSVLAGVKKQMATIRQNNAVMQWSINGHAVDARRIVNMLQNDDLLKDSQNYNIRMNSKGLYINGKKQDKKYYDKYKNIIGDNTTVEIKKHKGSFKSSVSSRD